MESSAVRQYLSATAERMAQGRLEIQSQQDGAPGTLVGERTVKVSEFPVQLSVCVATFEEITLTSVREYRRAIDSYGQVLRRRRPVRSRRGTCAVAALVSERVDPAVFSAVKNKPTSYGVVIVPAVVDLGARRLHIPGNNPIFGIAMWRGVRQQAHDFLPEPREVLG
ncbi:hypothetical protein ACFVMC_19990 [Nocardia sp. NPDC127579]|uniref:hypothetical protein n=1 Tax=Nocardia sp. NPDC127579 TaxID=3345402 RepID=UPI003626E353